MGLGREPSMRQVDARRICGIVTAALCVLVAAHMVMGGLSLVVEVSRVLEPAVWAGVALLAAHVAVCIVTSYQMMTDEKHPASRRKKRHLALKWASGAFVLAAAAAHIAERVGEGFFAKDPVALALCAALAVLAAWHACVGAKSLLKDLDVDRRHRLAFRATACATAAAAICLVVACALSF